MNKIKILLVDDHRLIRETWALLLKSDPRFDVIAETSSAEEAIEIAVNHNPDIVLTDINMSPVDGFELTKMILEKSPRSKVIALSMNNMPSYARQIIQIGGHGYITKNSSWEEMKTAIVDVYNGNKFYCEEIKLNLVNNILGRGEATFSKLDKLSIRELQIAKNVRNGYSSKEIAEQMCISRKTVEVHRYNILKKLALKNTASLVNLINQQAV